MKKLVVALMFLPLVVFAGNKEALRQEQETLSQNRAKYQQAVNLIDMRLVEIQGVLKYIDQENARIKREEAIRVAEEKVVVLEEEGEDEEK